MEHSGITARLRNRQVRSALEAADRANPGFMEHAQRVAVYSVAVGDQVGMESDALLALRYLAELHRIESLDPELVVLIPTDLLSREIVKLCERFDILRTGYGDGIPVGDDECVRWLSEEAIGEFDARIVEALLAVQSVIQPIGT